MTTHPMERAIVMFLALIVSLVVHEYLHALTSYLLGDETAKRLGRLTLNPLAHADPIGTFLLPLLAIISNFPVIGWAKPVPFNPYNLRDQKWGPTLVALAGPLANFGLAALFVGGLHLALGVMGLPLRNLLVLFMGYLVLINIVLGIFNFIPVPPLDGSKLLTALLDAPKYRRTLYLLETRGPSILFLIIMIDLLMPFSILGTIFGTAITFVFSVSGLRPVLAML